MQEDNNEVVSIEEKKPCTFCLFVRYFGIVVFLLTIAYYFFVQSQKTAMMEKENSVLQATMQADMR